MQFTIDLKNNRVSVDGITRLDIDLTALNAGVKNVRWYGDYGTVEYILAESPQVLRKKRIVSYAEYQAVLNAFAVLPVPVIPEVSPVGSPQQVTMRQARLALLNAGLLDTVEAAILAAGPAAKIEWEYAQEVQRNSGLVPAMATALGMTALQIDGLFIAAAAL